MSSSGLGSVPPSKPQPQNASIISGVRPSKMASAFKAGGASTAWSVFSVVWWGPARPAVSYITGTVAKVTATALKPLGRPIKGAVEFASAPLVDRVVPAISQKSASFIVDNASSAAIESGNAYIDEYVSSAVKEVKNELLQIQKDKEKMEAERPQRVKDLKQIIGQQEKSNEVQQMLILADKVYDADAQVEKASAKLKDYKNDPSLDSIKREVNDIAGQLEQANKVLAAFDSQVYKNSSWTDVLTRHVPIEVTEKRIPLSDKISGLTVQLEQMKKRLSEEERGVEKVLIMQKTQVEQEFNVAKSNFENCRIPSVLKLEAPLQPLKDNLRLAQQKLEQCDAKIKAAQTGIGRLTGVTFFVDSALTSERNAILKEIDAIQNNISRESTQLVQLQQNIKDELQGIYNTEETLKELEKSNKPYSKFGEQSRIFLRYGLVGTAQIAIDTPESLDTKKAKMQLKRLGLRYLPEQLKGGVVSLVQTAGENAKPVMSDKLVVPIRFGLLKGIGTGVHWVALKIAEIKAIQYLNHYFVPWATSFLHENISKTTSQQSDKTSEGVNSTIATASWCLGALGITIVAYKAMNTYSSYKEDQKRTLSLIEKSLKHGLSQGLNSVISNQSTIDHIAEIAGVEIYEYLKKEARLKGVEEAVQSTEKLITAVIRKINGNPQKIARLAENVEDLRPASDRADNKEKKE